jgi:hypothetical protein
VRFVVDGDPGWPAYDVPRRTVGLIDEKVSAADDPMATQRRAWAADQ